MSTSCSGSASEAATTPTTAAELRAAADQAGIVEAMPASARALVGLIGFVPTLDLLRRFGGERVYIPMRPRKASHPLLVALGAEAFGALVQALGGTAIDLPVLKSVERHLRDVALLADLAAGASPQVLRVRYRLTSGHVRKIIRQSERPPSSAARRFA